MDELAKQVRRKRNHIDPAGTMPLFLYPIVDGMRVKKGGHISKGGNIMSILNDVHFFYKNRSIREFAVLDTRDSACIHLTPTDVLNAISFLRTWRREHAHRRPNPPRDILHHTESGDLERFHKELRELGGI
jgi:hypothetical protein